MAGLEVTPGVKTMLIDYNLHAPIALRARFEVQGLTVLLGCSGAGKTSLLKALAGLLPATGLPWGGLPPQARSVGYLPQEAMLFPHLSVLENTAYALRGPTRLAQARALLAGVGLEDWAAFKPAQLSGGQAKRVALARALARGVELLLLDEPSAGLDVTTRDSMLDWLLSITTARDLPVLAATHDHHVAARADYVALLAEGRILQSGPAACVFAAPVSRAAAILLGYENVFEHHGAHWAIHADAITLAAKGEPFTVLQARQTGMGLCLTCGPAPNLTVVLRHGTTQDHPVGSQIQLDLRAAVRLAEV